MVRATWRNASTSGFGRPGGQASQMTAGSALGHGHVDDVGSAGGAPSPPRARGRLPPGGHQGEDFLNTRGPLGDAPGQPMAPLLGQPARGRPGSRHGRVDDEASSRSPEVSDWQPAERVRECQGRQPALPGEDFGFQLGRPGSNRVKATSTRPSRTSPRLPSSSSRTETSTAGICLPYADSTSGSSTVAAVPKKPTVSSRSRGGAGGLDGAGPGSASCGPRGAALLLR